MNWFLQSLYIYHWQDIVEIALFSAGIYYITRWLASDIQKHLLAYFYAGCLVIFASNLLHLTTVTTFLLLYWPGILMLVMIVHQRVLQKNLIFLKATPQPKTTTENWIETIIRTSFVCASKNKEVVIIFENSDSLSEHISCSTRLNTTIQEPLTSILLESAAFTSGNGIWVTTNGALLGINVTWPYTQQKLHTSGAVKAISDWQDYAFTLSSHADCLFIKLSLEQRTFDIIGQGTLIQDTPAETTIDIIKQFTKQQYKPLKKGAEFYENNNTKQPPLSHIA